MNLYVQNTIFSDNLLHKYLRENSYWYKYLNRNPEAIKEMIKQMKDKYKLNTTDKIERLKDKITMIDNIIKILE